MVTRYVLVLIVLCTVADVSVRTALFGTDSRIESGTILDVQFTDETYTKYTVTVNNELWLRSGTTGFRNNGEWISLKLNNVKNVTGQDAIGRYSELAITWNNIKNNSDIYGTIIRQYPNEPDIIIFTQSFPSGVTNATIGNADAVISSFPSFLLDNTNLGYLKQAGQQLHSPLIGIFGNKNNNLHGGKANTGPIAIFNKDMTNCIVLSALTDHMAASDYVDPMNKTQIQFGLIGNISTINAGYTISFILSSTRNGGGLNKAFRRWGDIQLKYYGAKKRGNAHSRDYTLNWLGYSTDNGCYYYYETEPGKNYQETVFDIKTYHDKVGLPTKWILLDSWWYYQGVGGGVKNWTAKPQIFPDGLRAVYQGTKWKIQAHNRYWALNNVYANNIPPYDQNTTGNYTFTYCPQSALPTQAKFWKYLFDINMDWGLIVYEQDWLSTVEDEVYLLSNSTTFGKQWLTQMATAARDHDVNIQFCMTYPRHLMTSVSLPAITQVRASQDYHPGYHQWQIGIASIFTSSIDVAPSKDSYWSQNNPQSGHYSNGTNEPYNRLHSVVLSLSNGPVTFGDRIGYSNVSLIMKCCTSSGLLLRPSISATMIDKYFVYNSKLNTSNAMGNDGRIWSTYSLIGDNEMYRYLYVFGVNLPVNYNVYPQDIEYNLGDSTNITQWLVYELNTTATYNKFNIDIPLTIKKGNLYEFQLYTLIPVDNDNNNNKWYLAGEIDKWITVSNQRFKDITRNNYGAIHVVVNGNVGETVNIAFVNGQTLKQQIVSCKIGETEQVIVHMPDALCLNY